MKVILSWETKQAKKSKKANKTIPNTNKECKKILQMNKRKDERAHSSLKFFDRE